MQGSGSEIGDELQLSFGISGSSGNGKHSHAFRSVLKTESAGKHSVAGRVLEDITGAQAYHVEASCNGVGPFVKVFLCVKNHSRITGCATG